MTSRFNKVLREIQRATQAPDSNGQVERRRLSFKVASKLWASTLKQIVIIAVCVTSVATSSIALAQQTAPVINKTAADGATPKANPIAEVWPANIPIKHISDVGSHKAVIFSPDFAATGNRDFYEKLGFLYIEDANWRNALNQIVARNYWHPEDRIVTVILETHGTNGNGLKLQTGPAPRAARSYISIGALQEKLDGLGVSLCVVGACNSGRLFRPEIFKTLNPEPHDRLFLPPTLGIINASKEYDPAKSKMTVVRRAASEIETTTDGDTSELSPVARIVLGLEEEAAPSRIPRRLRFAVSNLLIQMLIHDPRLELTSSGYANEKSKNDLSEDESDVLFQRFVTFIDGVAAREYQAAHGGQLPAIVAQRIAAPSTGRVRRPTQTAAMRAKRRAAPRVVD